MLDKQFFQDEQFHPYLTQNFLLFRGHRGQPDGDEIYKKFSVRATPTVMVVTADGQEIDLVLGYDPPPEKFKDTLEKTYHGENTFLNLMQAYEKDPAEVAVLARLVEKYRSNFAFEKMAEFAQKILSQPERARQVMLPFGKDSAEVSAYELARFAATYSGPEAVLEFATEFPTSQFLDVVFGDFYRSLVNKEQSEKASKVFDQLISKFPESQMLVRSYLMYCLSSKSNYDRGVELADRVINGNVGKIDRYFASSYANILLEKGDTQKVEHLVQELIKNNHEQTIEIEMQVGFYRKRGPRCRRLFSTAFLQLPKVKAPYFSGRILLIRPNWQGIWQRK